MSINLFDVCRNFGFGFYDFLCIKDIGWVWFKLFHELAAFMTGKFGHLGDVPIFDVWVDVIVERDEE